MNRNLWDTPRQSDHRRLGSQWNQQGRGPILPMEEPGFFARLFGRR